MKARYTLLCEDGKQIKIDALTTDEIWMIKSIARRQHKKDIVDVICEENLEGTMEEILIEILNTQEGY